MKNNKFLRFMLLFIPIYGVIGTIWGIAKQNYYAMISGIFCLIITFASLIAIICNITNKNKKLKKLQLEQKLQEEKEHNSLLYVQENCAELVKKYAQYVINFIEKLSEKGYSPFIHLFSNSSTPQSSILINPYRNFASKILCDKIVSDGLEFTESTDIELNKKIQELTDFFIKGLKKRIKENNEWQDEFTLSVLIYTIVRNNVINYYHDKYLELCGYESLEEFCIQFPSALSNKATMYYTYYKIYETDINLPLMETYHNICNEIKDILTKQKESKLENDLFESSKKKTVTIDTSLKTLSPIERVDGMSGAEFELFMTQYFKNQGFKTTHTPISGDYGIDLIIENDFGKIGVQAKRYKNKVSLDAVQQVVAGLRHYGLSSGIVITNNYFQPSAIRLAADNNITLWDRNKLKEKLGN